MCVCVFNSSCCGYSTNVRCAFHCFQQIPVSSWFDDPNDTELRDLIPFFEALDKVDNVLTVLGQSPMLPETGINDDEDLTQ